jgi:hypothetical protein
MSAQNLELARLALAGLNRKERVDLMAELSPVKAESSTPEPQGIITRKETAHFLKNSLRTVDLLARQGILHRVKLPGRVRGCGFAMAEVHRLVEGGK